MTPVVSIIVPVYGVERYIERCAVSLMEQTYKDIEYIFVNDATPDKSMEVLQQALDRYPKRQKDVKIVVHAVNKGLSAARNTGLSTCTGEWVWHVDSDDYIAPDAVAQLVAMAEAQEAEVVLFDVNVVSSTGVRTEPIQYKNRTDYIRRLIQHTEKCAHWNKLYRKSLLNRTGIRSDEQIRLAEDYAVTPRLMYEAHNIAVLHEPLYFYETTNQTSYVHNLSRTAIESQHRADRILIDYFADKAEFSDIVAVLAQRSMTSMIKNTNPDGWPVVAEVYEDCLQKSAKGMNMVNRIIFSAVQHHSWRALKCYMRLYHLIMQDR